MIGTRFTQVNYWDGLMDEVRIYDRILTQREIINDYHSGLTTHAIYRSSTFSDGYPMIDTDPDILVISHNESYDYITDYLESEGFNVTTDNSVDSVSAVDSYNPDIVMADGYAWQSMYFNTLGSSAGDTLLNNIYEAGYAIFTQGNDQDNEIRPISTTTATGAGFDWDVLRDGSFDHPITEGWDEVGQGGDSGYGITAIHPNAHSLGLLENNTDWYSFVYLQEIGKGKWVHAQSHLSTSSSARNRFLKNVINHLAGYVADNNYTDSDANDTAAPDVPTISAFGYNRTQVNITWTNPSDRGSSYFYYMKAFDYEGSIDSLTGNIGFESGSGTDANEWDGEDTSGSAQEYRMASSELLGHYVINVSVTDHTSQWFWPLHQDYESLGLSSASDWELNTKNKSFMFLMDYFCVLDSTIFILMRDQDSPCCNDSLDDTHIPCLANETGRINITFTTLNIDNMDNYLGFGVSNSSSGNWPMEVLFDNVEIYEIENDTLTTGFNELRIQNNDSGSWVDAGTDSSSPFEHGGLTPNTRYYYRAYSRDNQNNENSTPSSVVNNVTLAEIPSVTGVLCAGSQAAGYHCNVTFDMGSNPAGTEHYIEETTGNTGGSDQDWSSSTAMYQDTGLAAHTQYCYRIKARNLNNLETGYSSQACNTTENVLPTHSDPLLNSTSGNNLTSDNLTCWNQSTFDGDNDDVTNVYNWYKNDQQIMVLNMPFDTNVSVNDVSSVRDYSGYGNNGMLKNFDFDADSNWTSSGRVGGAYKLDGIDDYINITDDNSLDFGTGTFTVIMWTKNRYSSTSSIISKGAGFDANDDAGWGLTYAGSPEKLYVLVGNGTDHIEYNTGLDNITEWKQVGLMRESDNRIYFIENGSVTDTGNVLPGTVNNDIDITIGRNNIYSGDLNGTVDHVQIYDYALSVEQINALYLDSKDGYSFKSTVVSNETYGGEQWICEVTPTDGIGDGITKNSSALTVIGAGAGGQGTTCNSTNPCLFVENSTGVVARFDQFGYIDVKGSYSDSQSPPLTPPVGSFMLENTTGDVVMYIDKNGNIALLGIFNTQGSPSPSGGDDFIVQNSTDIAGYIDGETGEMYFKGELHYNSDF
ncbi:MAG: hypothetical protein JSV39_04675 [Candidatus Aenigmatarchaeota archaeon]|nr:MAG: hypothetical protein JSV39_04675 [Candidatus Aenigmarchaeota archaeon]